MKEFNGNYIREPNRMESGKPCYRISTGGTQTCGFVGILGIGAWKFGHDFDFSTPMSRYKSWHTNGDLPPMEGWELDANGLAPVPIISYPASSAKKPPPNEEERPPNYGESEPNEGETGITRMGAVINQSFLRRIFFFVCGLAARGQAIKLALMLSRLPVFKPVGAALLALLGYEVFSATEPAPLPDGVARVNEEVIPIPLFWETRDVHDVRVRKIPVPDSLRRHVEHVMQNTSHPNCKGRDGSGYTKQASVVKVERIENMALWKQYVHRKREIVDFHRAHGIKAAPIKPDVPALLSDVDGTIDPNLNEVYLFHGTTEEVAQIVAQYGFDPRVASLQGLYGGAVYHACEACKAAQYCKDRGVKVMLISRVILGDAYFTTECFSGQRRPPERPEHRAKGMTYDSVVANKSNVNGQVHREFMVYDFASSYPEFLVYFRPG